MKKIVYLSVFLLVYITLNSLAQNSCIPTSLRFNDDDQAYLNRNFNVGDCKIGSFSMPTNNFLVLNFFEKEEIVSPLLKQ